MGLDRDNPSSLQEQIVASLTREMEDGAFDPSGRLPSESELMARFAVSRVTVRLALGRLEREGRIERRQGKGSFAAGRRIRHELDSLLSFHESLKAQGLPATMRLLSHREVPVPRELRAAFGPGMRRCLEVRRLHLVAQEPVALATSLLPAVLADVAWAQAGAQPLYAVLEARAGLKVARAEIALRAEALAPEAAGPLGLAAGAPALAMHRTSFTADGRTCDRTVFLIRPERYEFCLNSATSARLGQRS